MYDASYEQIRSLEKELEANGITKDMLDLDMLAGATYSELKSVVKSAIAHKGKLQKMIEEEGKP